jgi:DICT domain-containing protein
MLMDADHDPRPGANLRKPVKGLAIKDVAERTGLAAQTIRMWEQRYGFPEPQRTAAGYRVYADSDVQTLRRVLAFRRRGLSVPAALERARGWGGPSDRPSIYGALAAGDEQLQTHVLRKRTLIAISHAIEDETLARAAGPIVAGAFQRVKHYRPAEHRYRRLAQVSDAVLVFADFERFAEAPAAPIEVPIDPDDTLGNEWAVVVDAPGFAACLLGWESPESTGDPELPDRERRFEAAWTLDPAVVRRAVEASAELARRADAGLGERLDHLLAGRPLASEAPAPALTALTNRILAYVEG